MSKLWGESMKYYIMKCIVIIDDTREENYGLAYVRADGGRGYICDISQSREKVEKLIERLNIFYIEECHLHSIIEDFKFENDV